MILLPTSVPLHLVLNLKSSGSEGEGPMCPPPPGEVAPQGADDWGPGLQEPASVPQGSLSLPPPAAQVSTQDSMGRLRLKPSRLTRAWLISMLQGGEKNKGSPRLRLQVPWGPHEHLQLICPCHKFGFWLFLLPPDSSGQARDGNKYPQSTATVKAFPVESLSPWVEEEHHPFGNPQGFPLSRAQSLKLSGHT